MNYLTYSFLFLICFMYSCGKSIDEPLDEIELNEIEDQILSAVFAEKISIYTDQSLQFEMITSELDLFLKEDSSGRRDLAGFGAITQEELAIYKGDFSAQEKEFAAVVMYAFIYPNGTPMLIPIASIKWKEALKSVKGKYKKRFTKYMDDLFESQRDSYEENLATIKLEAINEKLFGLLKAGDVTAYVNDNLSSVRNPAELEFLSAHKQEQNIPDPDNPDETMLVFVDVPLSASDITHYLPAYDDEENIVAVSMMIRENIQGFDLNTLWVAMDMTEVSENLTPGMMNFLHSHLAQQQEQLEANEEEVITEPADSTL